MTIWVAQEQDYGANAVVGVFASLEAAMAAFPDDDWKPDREGLIAERPNRPSLAIALTPYALNARTM